MAATALSRTASPEADAIPVPAGTEPLGLTVHDSLAAAEGVWRELETRGVFTPYQRFDWIAHWVAAQAETPRLAILCIEQAGRPVALLPLAIERHLGIRQATIIGSDIGNADWMLLDPAAAPLFTRARIARLLAAGAKRAGGIDLVALFNQPESWRGISNPLLAFPHQEGPNDLHFGSLNERGTFDLLDAKRLGHLLRRKRKLAEAHGEVVLRTAGTIEEIDRFHRVFLEQRGARFAQLGIANVFAEPHFVRFFRAGAVASLGAPRPAILLQALFAGEEIVATACGTFAGDHYSQYINATAGGEVAKYRLIGILMHEIFADVARRGGTSIDMGLGAFEYKDDWTVRVPVYDSIIPLTPAGRLAGSAILKAREVKRAIKRHDRLWALAKRVRALLRARPAPA
ncbi:MAG TPA: GNAT family N-acetyltransferase, partial [Alphaproteobacteria bacterium]|nr:GNAT family N-acetyltransferase [Alphaproteobacteria bacterium]